MDQNTLKAVEKLRLNAVYPPVGCDYSPFWLCQPQEITEAGRERLNEIMQELKELTLKYPMEIRLK